MGTYSKSTFGSISGTVGEGVGSKWRGIKVIRSLPTKSSKPASEAQLAVHARFALSAAQLSPIKDVLNIGFSDKKLNKITGYNAAVKLFLTEAIMGEYPNYSVDYSKITMSKGSLIPLAEVDILVGSDVSLSWALELNTLNAYLDDKVLFIIYNENKKSYRLFDQAVRGDGEISIPFGNTITDVLHIWVFCVNRDKNVISNSSYVGSTAMQSS